MNNFLYYLKKKSDMLEPAKPHELKKSTSMASIFTDSLESSRSFLSSLKKKSNKKEKDARKRLSSIETLDSHSSVSGEIQNINRFGLPNHLNRMPLCAEKLTLKLDYFCSLLDLPPHASDENIDLEIDFKSEMKALIERLNIEELYSDSVKDICEKIENFLQSNDYKSSSKMLKELLLILRDINIQKLIRLSKSNDESLMLIKDKQVNMLIGIDEGEKTQILNFLACTQKKKTIMDEIDRKSVV